MFLDPFSNLWEMLVLLADIILFAQVDEVDHRFGGEKEERIDNFDLDDHHISHPRIG